MCRILCLLTQIFSEASSIEHGCKGRLTIGNLSDATYSI